MAPDPLVLDLDQYNTANRSLKQKIYTVYWNIFVYRQERMILSCYRKSSIKPPGGAYFFQTLLRGAGA